jgi:hypothetical protein
MTTPDPAPGSAPVPDDATSTYDPDAARAAGMPPAGGDAGPTATPSVEELPWPENLAGLWPPAGSTPAAGARPPDPPAPGSVPPAPGSVPPSWGQPAGAVPPPGSVPPEGSVPPSWGWQGAGIPPVPARRSTPPGLVAGVILVIIGAALLVSRFVDLSFGGVTWPLWIVVPGVAMLVGSFFTPPRGGLGLAVPGTIITIVGLVLWVQEVYGLYSTWAYAWALVAPTGPGLAMLLYGLVHRDGELVGDGFRTTLVGLGLFLGFALFFEGVIGLSGAPIPNLDQLAPYGIIGLGLLLVVLSFFGNGRRRDRHEGHRHRQPGS